MLGMRMWWAGSRGRGKTRVHQGGGRRQARMAILAGRTGHAAGELVAVDAGASPPSSTGRSPPGLDEQVPNSVNDPAPQRHTPPLRFPACRLGHDRALHSLPRPSRPSAGVRREQARRAWCRRRRSRELASCPEIVPCISRDSHLPQRTPIITNPRHERKPKLSSTYRYLFLCDLLTMTPKVPVGLY